jgi:catechol 2,3-dioxygenase-like lactoylglutathione lyase family enzyme
MILDHVQIAGPPGCEKAARRFYGDVLGLGEIEKPEPMLASGGVWFQLGDCELHIGIANPFAPALKAHPGLRVEPGDLDGIAARLAGAQAPVNWDDRYPGVRRFYTADPFGNRLEILAS